MILLVTFNNNIQFELFHISLSIFPHPNHHFFSNTIITLGLYLFLSLLYDFDLSNCDSTPLLIIHIIIFLLLMSFDQLDSNLITTRIFMTISLSFTLATTKTFSFSIDKTNYRLSHLGFSTSKSLLQPKHLS